MNGWTELFKLLILQAHREMVVISDHQVKIMMVMMMTMTTSTTTWALGQARNRMQVQAGAFRIKVGPWTRLKTGKGANMGSVLTWWFFSKAQSGV